MHCTIPADLLIQRHQTTNKSPVLFKTEKLLNLLLISMLRTLNLIDNGNFATKQIKIAVNKLVDWVNASAKEHFLLGIDRKTILGFVL